MYTIKEDDVSFITNAILDTYDWIREHEELSFEETPDSYEITELLGECLVILDDLNNYKGILNMNEELNEGSNCKAPVVAAVETPTEAKVEAETPKKEETKEVVEALATNDTNKDIDPLLA